MKREINAKAVLRDIRNGLDDLTLMDKYKLTDRGLHSLFRKLVDAGLLTQQEINDRFPTFVLSIRTDSDGFGND